MQFMLGVYDFSGAAGPGCKPHVQRFTIDYFRGYRPL
jgi:hypothetical protein